MYWLTIIAATVEIMENHLPAKPDPNVDAAWNGPEEREHGTEIIATMDADGDAFARIYDDDNPDAWIEGKTYEI